MKRRLPAALLVCLPGIITASGCQCHPLACAPAGERTACNSCPRWSLFRTRTPVIAAPPPVVASPVPQPPPAAGSPVPQPALQAPVPSPSGPADYRSFEAPQVDQTWHAAPGSQPTPPGTGAASPEPPPAALRLLPPEPAPPTSTERPQPAVSEGRGPAPAVSEDRSRPPSLPVGIPQFATVRDQVAAGLKPSLDGGLDWLQANGYRTVLHVRAPGEDDSADRREVEKRGLKYFSLEVSPETLSRALVEQFSRIVNDKANYPLFVYDKNGMKAGALWYLTFRLIDRETDDAARTRAGRLGLKEDPEGEHRAMWLAIQKLLSAAGQ